MSSTTVKAEYGIELLTQSQGRPTLDGLEPSLFEDGPQPPKIFEFYGQEGTGKSQMLLHLITRCLLPKVWFDLPLGGLDAGVIFLDTDYKFPILRLVTIMEKQIVQKLQVAAQNKIDEREVESFIQNCLSKLTILHCSSSAQLLSNLLCLESSLCNCPEVSLLIIDSISAFYWIDKCNGGETSHLQEANMRFIAQTFQKLVTVYKLVGIVTKSSLIKPQLYRKDRGHQPYSYFSEAAQVSRKEDVMAEHAEFLCRQYQKIISKQFIFSKNSDSDFKIVSPGFCKKFSISDEGINFE